MLSLGFTKNGAMGAEALVLWNPEWRDAANFMRKQLGQLASKMRFQAAQFSALFAGELWKTNASNANGPIVRVFVYFCLTLPIQPWRSIWL